MLSRLSPCSSRSLAAALLSLRAPINRLRVMPKRLVTSQSRAVVGQWGRLVVRRPWPCGVGAAIVQSCSSSAPAQPSEAQAKTFRAAATRSSGAMRWRGRHLAGVINRSRPGAHGEGRRGGVQTPRRRRHHRRYCAGFLAQGWPGPGRSDSECRRFQSAVRGRSRASKTRCPRARHSGRRAGGSRLRPRGLRELPVRAAFVILLTYILLARVPLTVAALKAVILNLVSLGAAYGIIVHLPAGTCSQAIWGVPATQSIISWIPLMIFAFLFGLSMDYEVFMLTRIREAYDETKSTPMRSPRGRADGKLVTSAALCSCSPSSFSRPARTDIKQFGIGSPPGLSSTRP